MMNSVMPMANAPIVKHNSDNGNVLFLPDAEAYDGPVSPGGVPAEEWSECFVLLMMISLLPSLSCTYCVTDVHKASFKRSKSSFIASLSCQCTGMPLCP